MTASSVLLGPGIGGSIQPQFLCHLSTSYGSSFPEGTSRLWTGRRGIESRGGSVGTLPFTPDDLRECVDRVRPLWLAHHRRVEDAELRDTFREQLKSERNHAIKAFERFQNRPAKWFLG